MTTTTATIRLTDDDLDALELVFGVSPVDGLETLYRGYLIGPEWDTMDAPGSFDPRDYRVEPHVSARLVAASPDPGAANLLWLNVGPSTAQGGTQ